MIRMALRRTAAVFAAAVAFTVIASGTASASNTYVEAYGDAYMGSADWVENGDTLVVCDERPDGWGIRGYVYQPNPGDPYNGTVLIKASDPKDDGVCAWVSKDLSETMTIALKVCAYKGARIEYCDFTLVPR